MERPVKSRCRKFEDIWIPIPKENPQDFYHECMDANKEIWGLILKFNTKKSKL